MLSSQPDIPWSQIARMRDHLAHRYFDTAHAVLQTTVDNDLPELERAVQALAAPLSPEDQPGVHRPGRRLARCSGHRANPARAVEQFEGTAGLFLQGLGRRIAGRVGLDGRFP